MDPQNCSGQNAERQKRGKKKEMKIARLEILVRSKEYTFSIYYVEEKRKGKRDLW